jgi:NADPH:quinone reductase-like Zn-dependent oxidoreductase
VIGDALQVRAGQTVLVHGAGGVTGGMLVQLAAHRGATVADLPAAERDITMRAVQVAPDGRRLGSLVGLLAQGLLTVSVDDGFPLERAGAALARARHGAPRLSYRAADRRPRRDLTAAARASFWGRAKRP